eukprot:jgi/Galph1/2651/GphlegSOOS_G1304.1
MTNTTFSKPHIRRNYAKHKSLQPLYISKGLSTCQAPGYDAAASLLYPTIVTSVTSQAILVRFDQYHVMCPVACFSDQLDTITCMAVSNNGNKVAISYRSSLVVLYAIPDEWRGLDMEPKEVLFEQLPSIEPLHSWRPISGNIITYSCFECSDSLLATATTDGKVKVWDMDEFRTTHSFKTPTNITKVCFHPRIGQLELFVSLVDGRILVYDLATRNVTKTFQCHQGATLSFDFLFRGNYMISSGSDNTMVLFHTSHTTPLQYVSVEETITTITAIPQTNSTDSHLFASASSSGHLTFWTLKTEESNKLRKWKQIVLNKSYGAVESVYVPWKTDGFLLVGMENDDVHMIDITTMTKRTTILGNLDEVYDVCVLGDHNKVAVATNSEDVYVFDTTYRWKHIATISGHSDSVLALDYDSSNQILVTGARDQTCRLWKLSEWNGTSDMDTVQSVECVAIAAGHAGPIGTVSIAHKNPQNNFFVSGSADLTLKLWKFKISGKGEIQQLSARWTVAGHQKDINCIAISPNGELIVTVSQDKTAKIWSSKDGSHIATCSGHRRGVWSVSFSPVDRIFATSSGDCTIRIWSAKDGACLQLLEGSPSSLLRVLFLNAGTQLASGGTDGVLRIWNLKTGDCLCSLEAHDDRIWALANDLDGEVIISGGADGRIILWKDVTVEKEIEEKEAMNAIVLKQQTLENALRKKDWNSVFSIALELDQPHRLSEIIRTFLLENEDSEQILIEWVKELSAPHIYRLLCYCRDWNTTVQNYLLAQQVLRCLFVSHSVASISSIPNAREVLKGIMAYSERHYDRLSRWSANAYMLELMVESMKGMSTLPLMDG